MILNKLDLVSEEQRKSVRGYLHGINPDSDIYETTYSKIDLKEIFKKRFDIEKS